MLDSSKLKEFADDNFKFDENGRDFSIRVQNCVGKRTNCLLDAISPFPTVFSKEFFCRHVKRMACLGKGLAYLFGTFTFFRSIKMLYSTLPVKLQNVEILSKEEKVP